jgi:hypothetical protein
MLILIHQQSDTKYQQQSINILQKIAKKINKNYKILLIDLTLNHEFTSGNITYVPGSNDFREFSCYYIGLKRAYSFNPTSILFTNETFFRYREFILRKNFLIKKSLYAKKKKQPMAVGEIHKFLALKPYPFGNSNEYISTYYIFLNENAVKIVKNINFCIFNKSILNKNLTSQLIFNSNFSTQYFDYCNLIEKSLHLGGHKVKWHSFKSLTPETFGEISLKGFSIVIEHAISQLFVKNNIQIVNAIPIILLPYLRIVDRINVFLKKYFT